MDCKARGRSVLLHPCLFHPHSHLKPIASTFQKRLPSSPCIKNTPATNISAHPGSVWRRSVSDTVLRLAPVDHLIKGVTLKGTGPKERRKNWRRKGTKMKKAAVLSLLTVGFAFGQSLSFEVAS